jgi:parallel beta-helix repeat protein
MSRHQAPFAFGALLLAAAFSSACGDSKKSEDPRFKGCDNVIKADATTDDIQAALIDADTGTTICFSDGTYEINDELSLTVANITLQGNPADRSKVVLDYSKQKKGQNSLTVTGDGFTVQHMTVKNSHGDTIVVRGAKDATFRDLKVFWDSGSATENGAYAVYPVNSENILVEGCEVVGSSDSGIYVGQSKHIIVRNNEVHGNVAGIEIENSDDALVTGNKTYDNSAGILVFAMPNLQKKDGNRTIVEDNEVYENNHANFAEKGTTVSFVPPGTGILVLANDGTEVRGNNIHDNKSAAVLAVSYMTYAQICDLSGGDDCATDDPKTDPYLSKLYVHDNTYADNSKDPYSFITLLIGDKVPDVIWDGVKPPDALKDDEFCLGKKPATVSVFGDNDGLFEDTTKNITDASKFECTLPAPFDSIDLPQLSKDDA